MNWSLQSPLVSALCVGYPSVRVKFNLSNFQQSQSSDGNVTYILPAADYLRWANGLSSWEEQWLSKSGTWCQSIYPYNFVPQGSAGLSYVQVVWFPDPTLCPLPVDRHRK